MWFRRTHAQSLAGEDSISINVHLLKYPMSLRPLKVWVCLGAATAFIQAWVHAVFVPNPIQRSAKSVRSGVPEGQHFPVYPWTILHIPLFEPPPNSKQRTPMRWFGRKDLYADVYGWPFPSMAALFSHPFMSRAVRVEVGLGLSWSRPSNGTYVTDMPRVLPLFPLIGFVYNVSIFAGGWAVVWGSFTLLRRRARLRSGRCPACAYEIGTGRPDCPECGWGRHTATRSEPVENTTLECSSPAGDPVKVKGGTTVIETV